MQTETTSRVSPRVVFGALANAARSTLLVVWFCAMVVLMSALAIRHQFSLAAIDQTNARLAAAVEELLGGARGEWTSIHALYSQCRCSQRIFTHLRSSQRPTDLREVVLLVGDDPERAIAAPLIARGFEVVPTSAETLATRFGIAGAPTFALIDPSRTVRYLGGYTLRKQGPEIHDLAIVATARKGRVPDDLPVFGCAVSQRLQALLDPFTLRR